jgi:predicted RNA binding protein YcfA (HicA-like mRNA interferase family)
LPKTQRLTAADAERLLLRDGFEHLRTKGSHRIYFKGGRHIVVPFHGKRTLHPKIVRQILRAMELTD